METEQSDPGLPFRFLPFYTSYKGWKRPLSETPRGLEITFYTSYKGWKLILGL